MARISIKNMMFYGFHGIYEYEREQGQKFFIDVELGDMVLDATPFEAVTVTVDVLVTPDKV